jgi:hypothetical protein
MITDADANAEVVVEGEAAVKKRVRLSTANRANNNSTKLTRSRIVTGVKPVLWKDVRMCGGIVRVKQLEFRCV